MYEDCIEKFSCNRYPNGCSEECYRIVGQHTDSYLDSPCCENIICCDNEDVCCKDNKEVFPDIRYVEGPAGRDGTDGKSLEFEWVGDQLAVRVEGEKEYEYSEPLTGDTGPEGKPGNTGLPGNTPYIGENGNWWIGELDTGAYAKPSNKAEDLLAGNLASGMSCEKPTEDKNIANKEYVDTTTIPNTVISNFWVGTQAEYDAIETKNEKTLYLIQE